MLPPEDARKMDNKTYKMVVTMSATLLILSMIQTLSISITWADTTLTLSEYSGNAGEKIVVSGEGAPPGSLIRIYWDRVITEKKLNETYAKGNGTFSCYVLIPKDVVGSHWVIADGTSAEFLIKPGIVLNPRIGLPHDTVTVNATGFAAESRITVALGNKTVPGEWNWSSSITTAPVTVKSDTKGSFNCSFTMPDLDYGDYIVNVTDENGNVAEADFRIGATVTLVPTRGASGVLVTIDGRGFAKLADRPTRVTIDGTMVPLIADIKIRFNGTFTGQFVIPTLNEGEYTVKAMDESGISGNATFKVTKKTDISLTPRAGPQGIEVTIEGTRFTNVADTKVAVRFGILAMKDFYTNSTGGFKGTFIVPSLPNDIYIVTATDTNGLNATAFFMIASTGLALGPRSGGTGTIVKAIGYGFTSGSKAHITFDAVVIAKDVNVADLETGITIVVPTVPIGAHIVTATDEEGFSASDKFDVTETTTLTVTPDRTTHNASITVEARYFTHQAGTPLTFRIRNSTWDGVIVAEVETDETGSFKGTFEIPDYRTVSLGDYTIKARDDNGLVAEAPLSIVYTVYMGTRSSEYMPGDIVSFYVGTTFTCNFKIQIIGPSGFVRELVIREADWQTVDGWTVVPYEKVSFTLPSDAELGVWNWSATLVLVRASGSFTVVKPTGEKLYEEVKLLRSEVSSLEGNLTSLSQKLEEMSSEIGALGEETLSSVRNDISNMRGDLETLKNHISSAEKAARNAQQTASNLTQITYIVLAISIVAAVVAALAFIAIIALGRILTERLRL